MARYSRKSPVTALTPEVETRLVSRAQAGDSDAFSILYEVYVQAIYHYLLLRVPSAALAEDLTADVILRAVDALPRYSQRGVPFGAWLFSIARHRLTDYYRQTARRPTAELSESLVSDLPDPSESAEDSEIALALRKGLEQLTDEQRDVVQFRFVEGWNLEQTARAMNKSINAVKALQHRALNTLYRLLRSKNPNQSGDR